VLVSVNFSISNTALSVTLKEGTTQINGIWAPGSAIPVPTVTPFSSDEPVPFTAVCTVVTSYAGYSGSTPCTMNGGANNSASGVAYTWGYPLLVGFDANLFTAPLGTAVKVTVAVFAAMHDRHHYRDLRVGRNRYHRYHDERRGPVGWVLGWIGCRSLPDQRDDSG